MVSLQTRYPNMIIYNLKTYTSYFIHHFLVLAGHLPAQDPETTFAYLRSRCRSRCRRLDRSTTAAADDATIATTSSTSSAAIGTKTRGWVGGKVANFLLNPARDGANARVNAWCTGRAASGAPANNSHLNVLVVVAALDEERAAAVSLARIFAVVHCAHHLIGNSTRPSEVSIAVGNVFQFDLLQIFRQRTVGINPSKSNCSQAVVTLQLSSANINLDDAT
mmetsp:Transcript_17828/g.35919  ORF Transcript_17828/g.35919 Transcript_17828/m.35919 type:complete len:221 (-) Transcript_17828:792-1454(-)